MKPQYLLDCPSYLKDFLNYLRVVCNYSELTENGYYLDLRAFLRYLKVLHGDSQLEDFDYIPIADTPLYYLEDFTLFQAYDYMTFLMEVRKNSNSSRYRKTSSLRSFYSFLSDKANLISTNPLLHLEYPKVTHRLPKYLDLEQSMSLLSSVDSKNQKRDFCIILLFLSCGLRLGELCRLDVSDYNSRTFTLRVFGKGSKERILYLNHACVNALQAYLAVRPRSELEPAALFLSSYHTAKRLSERRVHEIIRYQMQLAGLEQVGLSPHGLRHTAATLMYEGGVDLLSLKRVLGHSRISSTLIYTHLSDNLLKRASELSPFAEVENKKDKKI